MNDCNGQQIIWRATQSRTLDCPLQDLPVPWKEKERIQMRANDRSSQFPCLHLAFSLCVSSNLCSATKATQAGQLRPAMFLLYYFVHFFFFSSFLSLSLPSFLTSFLPFFLCFFFFCLVFFSFHSYLLPVFFFSFFIPPYLVWFAGSVSSDNT